MTQPSFAPVPHADQVRPSMQLKTPADWRADRVADLHVAEQPHGPSLGIQGTDQGYALKLAEVLFVERLELVAGERAEDAVVGCAMVASARASLFGRAPVGPDLDMAFTQFGFLGGAPKDLIEWRVGRFSALAHHYDQQRRLVASVPQSTLRLTAGQVRERLSEWKELLKSDN
jgi:hypothetical protein